MPETTETLSLGIKSQPMVDGFRKAGAASRKFSEKFTRQMKSVTRSARKTGLILSATLTAPIVLMGRKAVKAFQAQEDAVEALRSALGGAGREVNAITNDFAAYSASIQQVTIYGDELLISQAAYMKNLGVEAHLLKDATKAAVGLAARYRIDLQTAAMLVGRASKGQTQMLTRYGIVMAETLSPQEKFNELLKIGAANFRLAEDAAKTTSGRMAQASNAFGDMTESMGEMIVTGLNFNKVAAKIVAVSKSIKAWFDKMSPATRTFLSVVLLLIAALGPLALGISAVTFVFGKLAIALVALKAITLASAAAFAILAAKIMLVVAAFKAGQWIGSKIRRLWTDEAMLEKMAKRMKRVATETARLNKEFAKFVKLSNVGDQGTTVIDEYIRRAELAKGTQEKLLSGFSIGMRKLTGESLKNITELSSLTSEGVAGEILQLRTQFEEYSKMAAALGASQMSRDAFAHGLKIQSKDLLALQKVMDPKKFIDMISGGSFLEESTAAIRALGGQKTDGTPAASAVSAANATLAVAGSIEAYRSEQRAKNGTDNLETAAVDTAENTAKTNRLLEESLRRRPAFSAVTGVA